MKKEFCNDFMVGNEDLISLSVVARFYCYLLNGSWKSFSYNLDEEASQGNCELLNYNC